MQAGSFREIDSHAQKVRLLLGSTIAGHELVARCTEDRYTSGVNVRVGDNFGELAERSAFATTLSGVLGSYSEIWNLSNANTYTLAKAYLNLNVAPSPSDPVRELIFLHTEPVVATAPTSDKEKRLQKWKSGPHLHVKASAYGIGRCHIHLDCCTNPCAALGSLAAYRKNFQIMVEMLSDELDAYFDPSQAD